MDPGIIRKKKIKSKFLKPLIFAVYFLRVPTNVAECFFYTSIIITVIIKQKLG